MAFAHTAFIVSADSWKVKQKEFVEFWCHGLIMDSWFHLMQLKLILNVIFWHLESNYSDIAPIECTGVLVCTLQTHLHRMCSDLLWTLRKVWFEEVLRQNVRFVGRLGLLYCIASMFKDPSFKVKELWPVIIIIFGCLTQTSIHKVIFSWESHHSIYFKGDRHMQQLSMFLCNEDWMEEMMGATVSVFKCIFTR